MAYMRLGDLLIASGVITQEQLDKALAVQKARFSLFKIEAFKLSICFSLAKISSSVTSFS